MWFKISTENHDEVYLFTMRGHLSMINFNKSLVIKSLQQSRSFVLSVKKYIKI